MSDKVQKIKEEIERLYKHYLNAQEFDSGYNMALDDILNFIDSLPEEHFDYTDVNIIPKDFGELPQTIEQAAVQSHIELEESDSLSFVNIFSKGAEWQKNKMKEALQTEYEKGRFDMREEMLKDAMECTWGSQATSAFMSDYPNIDVGDKVKIVVLKTE